MPSVKLPPPSGFLSWDFILSILTVISNVVLSVIGFPSAVLQSFPGGSTWLPIAIVALLCLGIIIKTLVKVRGLDIKKPNFERHLPASSEIDVKARSFIDMSEVWLGLAVVVVKLLQEYNALGATLNTSVTTTFLILGIVYALSQSLIRQAYLRALLFKVTKSDSTLETVRSPLARFTPDSLRR